MRTKLLIVSALLVVNLINAAIWRVSQDDSYLPHFKTVQAAIDGANAGDTVYVYPGTYDGVILNKTLAIFGAGYYLNENANDSIIRFKSGTSIATISLNKSGSNSYLQSISIYDGSPSIYCDSVSNFEISNCNIVGGICLRNSSNIIIQKSIIGGNYFTVNGLWNSSSNHYAGGWWVGSITGYLSIGGFNCKAITISNNIISDKQLVLNENSEAYVKNNIISGDVGISNSTIENNILMGNNFYFTNCWSQYNVIKTGSNYNYPLNNSIFATYEQVYPVAPVTDHFQLIANSVAKAKGEGGTDCGPFGGEDTYQISGISTIPSIVDFNVKAQATEVSGLKMRIKIKANK